MLMNIIAEKAAKLACQFDQDTGFEIYKNEYLDQLTEKSHQYWLRQWIGNLVEEGNKEAIEIMKLIIRFNLSPA